jgi:hypothetical protein
LLSRRAFTVFGGLGTSGYLGRLAWRVFQNSALSPSSFLSLVFAVIRLVILRQRREKRITTALRSFLSARVRNFPENGR